MSFFGTTDWLARVSAGLVSGAKQYNRFGINDDIDNGVPETLRSNGGTFAIQDNIGVLDISSSSTSDDGSPAGTGARTVTVDGTDTNGAVISETVTMDGTTTVSTSAEFLGVNRVVVATAGSNTTNVGNITVVNNTSGETVAYIPIGLGVTQQLIHYVPENTQALIYKLTINADRLSGGSAPVVEINFWQQTLEGVKLNLLKAILDTGLKTSFEETYYVPKTISGGSVWWVEVETDTNNTFVRGEVHQIILDD